MDAPYLLTEIKDRKPNGKSLAMEYVNAPEVVDLCERVVQILEIDDYVRMDVREDRFGQPLPIDINTGAFLTGRSFELACRHVKGSTSEMFKEIVRQSWLRQKH